MDLQKLFEENFINFETVFDSILDGVVIATIDKKFLFWNKAARKILGDVPDESDPRNWAHRYRLYHLDNERLLDFEELPMIRALKGEEFTDYKIITKNINHPEGIILSLNGRPIRNGEALVAGITTFRDITNVVRQENDVKSERSFYRRILNLMPGIVFIKDLDGKFIYGNEEFHEILKATSIVGKKTNDYLDQEMTRMIKAHDELVLSTKVSHDFEENIIWPDGTMNQFRTVRFPYWVDGKITGICAVSRDISSEVESQNHLDEIRNRSQQLSKLAAVGTLSAEIAHEIRNPLTILKTSIDVIKVVLEDGEVDKEFIKNKIQVINETIMRMSKVTNSLGIISKDSSMEQFSLVRVSEILEDVISLCSFKSKKMKMNIELDKGDCGETLIHVNQVQISEVVLNLVMNALDAVEKKQNPVVKITCGQMPGYILIKVYDNGQGVPAEIQEKIFEPFFTTKNAQKGNGLGLSISSKIVKQHEGELFYSEEGYEHAFVLKLPLSKMATPS